jgi:hypothetical protein
MEKTGIKGQVMSVTRQVTARTRGKDGLSDRKKDKRSGGSVWAIRQVTARVTGKYWLTNKGGG